MIPRIGLVYQGQFWNSGLMDRVVPVQRLSALLGSTPLPPPAFRALAERLRMLVLDGQLLDGVRLPSERDLSQQLQLSRTTVAAAYALLRDRGVLTARRGAGNYLTVPNTAVMSALMPSPTAARPDGVIGLTCASSAAPPGVAAAYARALDRLPSLLSGTGYFPDGLPSLRESLAAQYAARGLPTDPDQLIITSGALSALNIVGRYLLNRGDRAVLESPTYSNAITALQRAGARMVGLPVGEDGTDHDQGALEHLLRQSTPRLAYLMPDFHNPTGALMDDDTRSVVARALTRAGTVPVVDETLAALPLDDPANPSTATMPAPFAVHSSRTLTLGSASKAYWGGLRVGWIRAPRALIGKLVDARVSLDLGAAPVEQLVLADLIGQGDAVLTGVRQSLRSRRDHLLGELARMLPDWTTTSPAGGLCLWIRLPEPTARALAAAAERRGVLVTPGPPFHVGSGGERHLRLPFTASEDLISEAVRRLAAAYDDVRRGASTRDAPAFELSA